MSVCIYTRIRFFFNYMKQLLLIDNDEAISMIQSISSSSAMLARDVLPYIMHIYKKL